MKIFKSGLAGFLVKKTSLCTSEFFNQTPRLKTQLKVVGFGQNNAQRKKTTTTWFLNVFCLVNWYNFRAWKSTTLKSITIGLLLFNSIGKFLSHTLLLLIKGKQSFLFLVEASEEKCKTLTVGSFFRRVRSLFVHLFNLNYGCLNHTENVRTSITVPIVG